MFIKLEYIHVLNVAITCAIHRHTIRNNIIVIVQYFENVILLKDSLICHPTFRNLINIQWYERFD